MCHFLFDKTIQEDTTNNECKKTQICIVLVHTYPVGKTVLVCRDFYKTLNMEFY